MGRKKMKKDCRTVYHTVYEDGQITAVAYDSNGRELLGLGSVCCFSKDGYLNDTTDTYYGEAIEVVRADGTKDITVQVTDGKLNGTAAISLN